MVHTNSSQDISESAKEMGKRLPFKLGEVVEAKSFSAGYRGAWFACKIVEMDKRIRHLRYRLQYIHFPEEALHWSQAYQQRHRGQADSMELMLRPLPPPILQEEDLPYASYDGIVVVPYLWEVGDLVNWWCDDVWWEAIVSEVMGRGKVKISLFKPPVGEGGVHVAKAVELRPSLSWSVADEWTLPISKKKANGKPAARIVELLSSKRWLKVQQLQPARVVALGKVPAAHGLLPGNGIAPYAVNDRSNQAGLAIPSQPSEREELDQKKVIDDVLDTYRTSNLMTVPLLETLREAVNSLLSVDTSPAEGNRAEDNRQTLSKNDRPQQQHFPGCGVEDDSEELAYALYLRWQLFKKRNRKFKRYRNKINKAVDLLRRKRFKVHIFTNCNIIDSQEGNGAA